ncbi:MAG: VWA domain-containing protein [Candidatus Brocadiae bacterium]|nr:VWA domain-containing protein [Candidatus Brocadiia bacterium]
MSHNEKFLDRLYQAVENLHLDALLNTDLNLRVTTAVPVAAWVYNETQSSAEIHVNPRMDELLSDRELQVLMLHELIHYAGISSYYRLPNLDLQTTNCALDIAINASIMRGNWSDALASLNDKILLSGSACSRKMDEKQATMMLTHHKPPKEQMPDSIYKIWQYLWERESAPSPEECYQQIAPLMIQAQPACPSAICLSNGEGDEEILWIRNLPEAKSKEDKGDSTEKCDRSSNVDKDKPDNTEYDEFCKQAGTDSNLHLLKKKRRKKILYNESMEKWIQEQIQQEIVQECMQIVVGDLTQDIVYYPYICKPTQGALIRESFHWPTVYYANRMPAIWQPLAVYIDVSGSMAEYQDSMLSLLQKLEELLPSTLWMFDTNVKSITKQKVMNGHIYQGGGTDFNAVFLHAMKHSIKDFLVFTDGMSVVSQNLQKKAYELDIQARAILFCEKEIQQPWWYRSFLWHR